MIATAWRNWYHCTVGTYAQWLPGDKRGWRERDHHEHVDGDYKTPPPPSEFHARRWQYSKCIMKGEPYLIAPADRKTIGCLLLETFTLQRIPILALAVGATHFHALVQCENNRPNPILGHAKKHVMFNFSPISDATSRTRQKLWEGESGVKPIMCRPHGVAVYHYILDHAGKEGAWVWSFRNIPS